MSKRKNLKVILGWITTIISLSIIIFWSYWGINEAFHEGWYHTSLLQNLSLTFIQYLSIPVIFLTVSLLAMNYKRFGSGLFISLGIFAMFFFNSNAGRFLILIPPLIFALGFYFGEFKRKKIFHGYGAWISPFTSGCGCLLHQERSLPGLHGDA